MDIPKFPRHGDKGSMRPSEKTNYRRPHNIFMNSNRRVLQFVTGSISIYVMLSIAGMFMKVSWVPFRRVNLISDVMLSKDSVISVDPHDSAIVIIEKKPDKNFELYKTPKFITSFSANVN